MTRQQQQQPPHDADAERAVLSCVLADASVLPLVALHLTEDSFFLPLHQVAYAAISALSGAREPVDHVTVGNRLALAGIPEAVWRPLIQSLYATAEPQNAAHYARIVGEFYTVRRMISVGYHITECGYDVDNPRAYIAESTTLVAEAAQTMRGQNKALTLSDDLRALVAEVEAGSSAAGVIKTGIPDIDEVTSGCWPGQMVVLAARPSMGKSALALNIATNVALSGKRVIYVSLEDARHVLVSRLVARFGDVDMGRIQRRDQGALRHIYDAARFISTLPLTVFQAGAAKPDDVRNAINIEYAQNGLDFAVVDLLTRIRSDGEGETAIMAEASRTTAAIAAELNIPVLAVTQLNRGVELREDRAPRLADLRQSGSVEEDARQVWLLYRPGYYSADLEDHRAVLTIAKNTQGRTGKVRLWFNGSRMLFRGWDFTTDGDWATEEAPKKARTNGREC